MVVEEAPGVVAPEVGVEVAVDAAESEARKEENEEKEKRDGDESVAESGSDGRRAEV